MPELERSGPAGVGPLSPPGYRTMSVGQWMDEIGGEARVAVLAAVSDVSALANLDLEAMDRIAAGKLSGAALAGHRFTQE